MRPALVILDFDGTFTDSEAEGAPFATAFPYVLAWHQQAPDEFIRAWSPSVVAVRHNSPEEGWFTNGVYSAPADADPYIRCSAAGLRMLRQFGMGGDDEQRGALLAATYAEAYACSATSFRPHATEALDRIVDSGARVVVVTNSEPTHVAKKIDHLGLQDRAAVTVVGNAMKFWVDAKGCDDPAFAALPTEQRWPGLQRSVLLKRSKYFNILAQLWRETGCGPAETLVCGDIYELDLALPAALGARVALMKRANTYGYERAAVAALGLRGRFIYDLREVADWVTT